MNQLDILNVIHTFVGILHLSSKKVYTTEKHGVIRKEMTPFIKNLPNILVKTKKIEERKDMYVIVKIDKYENDILFCNVVEYIGFVDDNTLENKLLELSTTCHWKNKICTSLIDLTPERSDYTQYEIYTIDPDGCNDIDDALHYLYINETQEHEIGIHIADVSSFIEENSILDLELKNRTETIYPINSINKEPIHMIPSELSINNISLKAGSIKRSFSIILRLNTNYEIIFVEFKKTNIIVKQNMSYELAEEMISSNESLKMLYDIGQHLNKNTEIYDTHQMVAIYMILANKYVAEKISNYDPKNVLLRVHKKNEFYINDNIDPLLIKKHNIINLEQANYQLGIQNSYHESLNLEFYTHMTSPIRRYADIIVHRQLWKVLCNQSLESINIQTINFYPKFYKQMERFMHIIHIANIIDDTFTNAYITYIHTTKKAIRLYIPKYELDYEFLICHPKLENIIKYEIKLKLFQNINIKLIASTNHTIKLHVIINLLNNIFI